MQKNAVEVPRWPPPPIGVSSLRFHFVDGTLALRVGFLRSLRRTPPTNSNSLLSGPNWALTAARMRRSQSSKPLSRMFQLPKEEAESLRSQFATSKTGVLRVPALVLRVPALV